MAALLAGCAGPAAAPTPAATAVPPLTATPVPPEAAATDSVAVVQAWHDALNNGDLDAAIALMTEDATISGWRPPVRGVLDWWIDIKTHFDVQDCQQDGEQLACDVIMTDDGCITASGNTDGLQLRHIFSIRDGKIQAVSYGEVANTEDWDRYWKWGEGEGAWAEAFRAEESANSDRAVNSDAGAIAIKLCQDYADFLENQVPVITASAQALVDAINSGDVDAAVAHFTDDAKVTLGSDKAAGKDQLSSLFSWLAGKETQVQITDCVWQGDKLVCTMSVVDGCMAASGASEGLPGMMTFNLLEDGALGSLVGVPRFTERKAYETWLEAEAAWASANRAEELAQAEGYSKAAGEMAVTLCQEYAAAPKLDDAAVTEIETMVTEMMAENEIPGYALGVVMDGEIAYVQGFGVERVGADKPVTPHTVFGTGSVGKTATATAAMQLVTEGKIDLDAPVTDYLPYFRLADERYSDITVYHLITHRSGLPEITDWYPVPAEYDDGALERYVRSLGTVELLFAPDEQWSYSGMGYTVLADIVAKVSGQPFEDYLQENVIDPLQMSDTILIVQDSDQSEVAGNHVRDAKGQVVVSEIFPYRRQFAATGPLYSSITDMARYATAHLNRGQLNGVRVLPETAYDAMWEPISETGWEFGPTLTPLLPNFGMSWTMGELDGHRIVSHFGFDEGYIAAMLLAPDDNVAVVVNSNYFDAEEFNMSAWETAIKVMQRLLAEPQ